MAYKEDKLIVLNTGSFSFIEDLRFLCVCKQMVLMCSLII